MNSVSNFNYAGPTADYASITGSPLWGLRPDEVIRIRQDRGWRLNFSQRVHTPYGLGPQVNHFTTLGGREVIWIPSYGGVRGEEIGPLEIQHRLFWILWQAGVKVLLVGGTSGTNDWRAPQEMEAAIQPGDIVLPWSFYRNTQMAGSLPGTRIGGVLPNLARMADPFCVSLSSRLAEEAKKLMFFRRVHGPQEVRVILRSPTGGSFESEAETLVWRLLTRLMSAREGFPYVMLHGDCISPILCRHLGVHEAYYHIPANWAEGHPATSRGLTEVLDELYVERLPQVMLKFEDIVLETIPIPDDCTCSELLVRRPSIYQEAMTQPEE